MSQDDCIFCTIVSDKSPGKIVAENDLCLAFNDIHKDAPEHLLIVPKKHLANLNEAEPDDQDLLGALLLMAKQVAQLTKIDQSGYRCIINTNQNAGEVVSHLHLHVLGGKPLGPIVQKHLPNKS